MNEPKKNETLVRDGIEEVPQNELQSYVARVRYFSSSFHVTIPIQIIREMQLKPNDIIEVAIRPADSAILLKHKGIYGKKKFNQINIVKCPKCDLAGSMQLHFASPKTTYAYIVHSKKKSCFIGRIENQSLETKEIIRRMLTILGEERVLYSI